MSDGSSAPKVAALVVAWRDLGETVEAVESLLGSTVALQPIVLVAQQYSNEDLDTLRAVMPGHDLVAVDDNIGFSASVNLGMSRAIEAGADWVLLINNDATIAAECVDRCLLEASRYDRVAAVGPAVVYTDQPSRIWFAGAVQSRSLAITWHRGYLAKDHSPPPSADSDYIPGCCVLIATSAWREIGPMRDDFFMYYEDAEWGERARLAGWRLRYLDEVLCHHAMAASSGQRGSRYLTENTAYYLARNPLRYALDSPTLALRISRTFGILTIWTAYNLTRIKPAQWSTVGRACATGLLDGWRGRMGRRDATSTSARRARPARRAAH